MPPVMDQYYHNRCWPIEQDEYSVYQSTVIKGLKRSSVGGVGYFKMDIFQVSFLVPVHMKLVIFYLELQIRLPCHTWDMNLSTPANGFANSSRNCSFDSRLFAATHPRSGGKA